MALANRRYQRRRIEDRDLHGSGRRVIAAFILLFAAAVAAAAILQSRTSDLAHHADRLSGAVNRVEMEQAQALGRLRAATVAGCQRQNLSTVKQNASNYADWKVFRVVIAETEAAPRPADRAARREINAFITPVRAAVAAKTWTPTLNCKAAVRRHGAHYVLPQPVPFNQKLPPRSALEVTS